LKQDCPIDHDAAERAVDTLPGPLRRGVYFSVGAVSVVMGVIGMLLPLWPTTCFLLLAAWCFARSSRRAEQWLYDNRLFGKYIADYRLRGVISPRIRATTVATMWTFMGIAAVMLSGRLWISALLILIAAAVTAHLYALPAAEEG
jgi:uncharacterized membrane protein YbaN (DUF454 family)